jgi:hypothetical protein
MVLYLLHAKDKESSLRGELGSLTCTQQVAKGAEGAEGARCGRDEGQANREVIDPKAEQARSWADRGNRLWLR